jgi:hypothetical protein
MMPIAVAPNRGRKQRRRLLNAQIRGREWGGQITFGEQKLQCRRNQFIDIVQYLTTIVNRSADRWRSGGRGKRRGRAVPGRSNPLGRRRRNAGISR